MSVLHIEHPVSTFDAWKAAFDSDPVGRRAGGVRRYTIYRPTDDPQYVALDLEFDDADAAREFQVALEQLWRSPQAAPALGGAPQARILDVVERTAV